VSGFDGRELVIFYRGTSSRADDRGYINHRIMLWHSKKGCPEKTGYRQSFFTAVFSLFVNRRK